MGMELIALQKQLEALVAGDSIADIVTHVAVESDSDEFGSEFLRVLVNLKPHEKDRLDQLSALISRIEDVVAQIDSRYPSVRFLDAA